jgi:hypothetical protein
MPAARLLNRAPQAQPPQPPATPLPHSCPPCRTPRPARRCGLPCPALPCPALPCPARRAGQGPRTIAASTRGSFSFAARLGDAMNRANSDPAGCMRGQGGVWIGGHPPRFRDCASATLSRGARAGAPARRQGQGAPACGARRPALHHRPAARRSVGAACPPLLNGTLPAPAARCVPGRGGVSQTGGRTWVHARLARRVEAR